MDWKQRVKENSAHGFAKAQALRAKRVVSKVSAEGAPLTDEEIQRFQEMQKKMREKLKAVGIDPFHPPYRWNRILF